MRATTSDNKSSDLLDLAIVAAKHKKTIGVVSLAAGVLALLVSFLIPNTYVGTTKLLPPQQSQSNAAMLLGQLGQLGVLANTPGSPLGLKNPNDLYVGMLRSRTVADSIIGRFSMQNLYGKSTMVETRKELADNSSVTAGKDGLITIEFQDRDPTRAAAVANAYAEELDRLTQSLAVTEAAQRRLFFDRQLQQAKRDLGEAEVALKVMQEKTGLIKLDDQGRALIEAVATLRAQIAAKEVELRAMRTFATEANSDYVRTQQQLAGLRAELLKIERPQITREGDMQLSTGKVPEAGLEYVRRFREVKYHETVFELLARQLEVARLDEAKEAVVIQVVDKALAPDRKTSPRRGLITVVVVLISALGALLWALAYEAKERATKDPAQAARFAALRHYASLRRMPPP